MSGKGAAVGAAVGVGEERPSVKGMRPALVRQTREHSNGRTNEW